MRRLGRIPSPLMGEGQGGGAHGRAHLHPSPPGMTRGSTILSPQLRFKSWMAGSRPAMTKEGLGAPPRKNHPKTTQKIGFAYFAGP